MLAAKVEVENWSAIEEFRNLPQILKDAGYRTALIGKYDLSEYEQPPLRFDFSVTFPEPARPLGLDTAIVQV